MEATPSWTHHIDLVQLTIVGLLTFIGYMVKRSVDNLDRTVDLLFAKYDGLQREHNELRSDFDQLHGEHKGIHSSGGRRAHDPGERP